MHLREGFACAHEGFDPACPHHGLLARRVAGGQVQQRGASVALHLRIRPQSNLVHRLFTFERHVDTPEKLADRVGLCVGFRNYLHYHIKAAKTNQHMRMRRKVYSWLQILNRAVPKPAAGREMKTATGRSFFRKK